MTQADNFSRSSKGILKISKHPPLTRSSSLQSKRTCFKDVKCSNDTGDLSRTFNFGCSLDEPQLPSSSIGDIGISSQHIVCASGDFMSPEVIQEEDIASEPSVDFVERRKSFELRPTADSFEGLINLRAILAHRIPDLEPEEDDEEDGGGGDYDDICSARNFHQDKFSGQEVAQSLYSNNTNKSALESLQSPDIEMSNSQDE